MSFPVKQLVEQTGKIAAFVMEVLFQILHQMNMLWLTLVALMKVNLHVANYHFHRIPLPLGAWQLGKKVHIGTSNFLIAHIQG